MESSLPWAVHLCLVFLDRKDFYSAILAPELFASNGLISLHSRINSWPKHRGDPPRCEGARNFPMRTSVTPLVWRQSEIGRMLAGLHRLAIQAALSPAPWLIRACRPPELLPPATPAFLAPAMRAAAPRRGHPQPHGGRAAPRQRALGPRPWLHRA